MAFGHADLSAALAARCGTTAAAKNRHHLGAQAEGINSQQPTANSQKASNGWPSART
uniref:hypothetical protein n=1 Tax=Aeromonas salmonicida TaxID=645 RepID=UPI0015E7E984|nr:hypothetical protein [Aeromonas salmonicida]